MAAHEAQIYNRN